MANPIAFTGLDIDDRGHILVNLSEFPSEEWVSFWKKYWQKPATHSTGYNKSAFLEFQDKRIVFMAMSVDTFVTATKGVADDARKYANEQISAADAQREVQARADKEAKESEGMRLERERAKARNFKFD